MASLLPPLEIKSVPMRISLLSRKSDFAEEKDANSRADFRLRIKVRRDGSWDFASIHMGPDALDHELFNWADRYFRKAYSYRIADFLAKELADA